MINKYFIRIIFSIFFISNLQGSDNSELDSRALNKKLFEEYLTRYVSNPNEIQYSQFRSMPWKQQKKFIMSYTNAEFYFETNIEYLKVLLTHLNDNGFISLEKIDDYDSGDEAVANNPDEFRRTCKTREFESIPQEKREELLKFNWPAIAKFFEEHKERKRKVD